MITRLWHCKCLIKPFYDDDDDDDDHLISTLVYGSEKFNFSLNKDIIKLTVCYLKDAEHFVWKSYLKYLVVFYYCYYHYSVALWHWFLTYIYSNFGSIICIKQSWVFLGILLCLIFILTAFFSFLFFLFFIYFLSNFCLLVCLLFMFMSSPHLQVLLRNISCILKVWVLFCTCILDFLFLCCWIVSPCKFEV